jgi:uncharacterized membrane protein
MLYNAKGHDFYYNSKSCPYAKAAMLSLMELISVVCITKLSSWQQCPLHFSTTHIINSLADMFPVQPSCMPLYIDIGTKP